MERLSARKAEWAALPIPQKLDILREIRARVLDQPLSWARASAQDVKRDPSQVRRGVQRCKLLVAGRPAFNPPGILRFELFMGVYAIARPGWCNAQRMPAHLLTRFG